MWEWNNNMGSEMRRQRLSELWYICALYFEQSDHTYLSRHYTWKTKGQLTKRLAERKIMMKYTKSMWLPIWIINHYYRDKLEVRTNWFWTHIEGFRFRLTWYQPYDQSEPNVHLNLIRASGFIRFCNHSGVLRRS